MPYPYHQPLSPPPSQARLPLHLTLFFAACRCTVTRHYPQLQVSAACITLQSLSSTTRCTSDTSPRFAAALPVATTAVVAPLLDDASLSLPASANAIAAAAAASGTVSVLLPRSLLLALSTAMQGQAILGERSAFIRKLTHHASASFLGRRPYSRRSCALSSARVNRCCRLRSAAQVLPVTHVCSGSLLCRVPLSASACNPLLFDSARLSAAAAAAAAAAGCADVPCDVACSASARCVARLSLCEARAALASLQVAFVPQRDGNAASCVVQRSLVCDNASHVNRMEEVRSCVMLSLVQSAF
jgi:hypothetical protein